MKHIRIPGLTERLKQAMEASRLTLTDLSSLIGRETTQVNSWLLGERQPSLPFFLALARELNVSADWLLGIDDAPAQSSDDDITKISRFMTMAGRRAEALRFAHAFGDLSYGALSRIWGVSRSQALRVLIALRDDGLLDAILVTTKLGPGEERWKYRLSARGRAELVELWRARLDEKEAA